MIKKIFILFVKGYQFLISPLLGNNCRFYPSCSQYMIQAIDTFGVIKGVYLGLKRLSKCHPWHEGGIDPIPSCRCQEGKDKK
ncbi:membrane protein insertion efficiency factor YidD [Marinomonas sp. M1K-6]|uniref:Putative membrane protein insertion efficiency factor n=1 Tax=Marinomonas profundi TaxID=2726122 RepID=A0A847RBK3_9GAMM|nr:membrane protein insertion efficiency factor YidD [Marinomonas profundi]NLQ18364.1 membrane protein insertion efficiency factor YidD [Marinomonas profundi]UDV02425.1 membrane protein insertion efficiency factor YidD [Marinomonas profundi]